ncbi:MAG TPA: IS66 family transposase [Nostoc sp.]|uniref:IS66 family transposase n=1 Tax=Nostoc sp. TaxID=1180 RepID=UPI002D701ADB|nr:IS66 family transposase [Nostoc sp.]HYX16779.1 IS66 family transposase [Nostoc sp.]
MTREEILAIYEAGPDPVVTLVQSLIAEFQAQVQVVNERVRELELRLAKDSHNSHKPPSSDEPTFRRQPPKSLRKPSGKKPGGQSGHTGCTRLQVEKPDDVHPHVPDSCAQCGDDLRGVDSRPAQRRQVVDLPPLALRVEEHCVHDKRCPGCGHTTRAAFPEGVNGPVQYGPRVQALAVYLQVHQLLPYDRTAELIRDLFGETISEGTLTRTLKRAHALLEPVEQQIHAALRQSPSVHFDETGLRIVSKRQWVHSAGTPMLTLYRAHAKRGREAIDAMGVLPGYEGVSIHDAYTSYLSYSGRHALCNAHLLRDLVAVEEETKAAWAPRMSELLLEIKAAATLARASDAGQLEPVQTEAFRARYDALLCEGEAAHPPSPPTGRGGRRKQSQGYNLVRRLRKHAGLVLAFMYDIAIPFDNNLAERDLRMLKTKQKISGGFRSQEGAEIFCRVRSYISTVRKQGLSLMEALRSVFSGTPMLAC